VLRAGFVTEDRAGRRRASAERDPASGLLLQAGFGGLGTWSGWPRVPQTGRKGYALYADSLSASRGAATLGYWGRMPGMLR
jgi:hypothetical protein